MIELSRDDLIRKLSTLEPRFRREGVTRLSLIGSRARGDHRPDSDIDLLVDIEEGRRFSLLDLIGLGHVVEDEFCLASSIIERRGAGQRFLDEVHRDEIKVFE